MSESIVGLENVYVALSAYKMKEQNLILNALNHRLEAERTKKLKDLKEQVQYVEEAIKGSEK